MPDFRENYTPGEQYIVDGILLNDIARRLNEIALLEFNNEAPEAEIGIVELITNDPARIKNKAGTAITGVDASNRPLAEWDSNTWHCRFVYLAGGTPVVAETFVTLISTIYAFSDLSNAGIQPNPETIPEGSNQKGMMPLFAPLDKIPAIWFRQRGEMIPFVGPPSEEMYYDFYCQGVEEIETVDTLIEGDSIILSLEFFDPEDDSWYYYHDVSEAMVPRAAFGNKPSTHMLGARSSINIKNGTKIRLSAIMQSSSSETRRFSVGWCNVHIKMKGRHWQTDSKFFNNGGDPDIINSYDRTHNEDLWAERTRATGTLGPFRAFANTRRRWRDMPTIEAINDDNELSFKIDIPNEDDWFWTAEISFQGPVFIDGTGTCPKIPGVDFNDLPIVPADEIDYVLAIKDNCLVKVEVDECPDPDA